MVRTKTTLMKKTLSGQIAQLLETARQHTYRQVNQTMVNTYFRIGQLIVEELQKGEQRAEYGNSLLIEVSKDLKEKFGRGFSVDNLQNMRAFYNQYSIQQTLSTNYPIQQSLITKSSIQQTLSVISEKTEEPKKKYESVIRIFNLPDFKLSWTHYQQLIRIENQQERSFYEIESAGNNWSVRELKRQINSSLFERLAISKNPEEVEKLSKIGQVINEPRDLIKEPYILEFLGLKEEHSYSENQLEQAIIDRISHFLKELGKGFMFVSRQERISFDERHFYCDLVFYNRILRCFVLIDLKLGELNHQDLGQIQMYVNYYDRNIKLPEENKTIGIVLCKDKSEALVEISLPENNTQIFATKYQTILPTKKQFTQILLSE